jgi:hypothetical protein
MPTRIVSLTEVHLRAGAWAATHPLTQLEFSGLGSLRRIESYLVSRLFTPAQVRRLGWPFEDVVWLAGVKRENYNWVRFNLRPRFVGELIDSDRRRWNAETFIRLAQAARAAGGSASDPSWADLCRLSDPELEERHLSYLRHPERTIGLFEAVQYGRDGLPYDVFVLLTRDLTAWWRAGQEPSAAAEQLFFQEMVQLLAGRFARLGWPGEPDWHQLATWVATVYPTLEVADQVRSVDHARILYDLWDEWTPLMLADRRPWAAEWWAAGFTPDEARTLIDEGREPDPETLASLAALRRER